MTLGLASIERHTNRMAWDGTEWDGTRWAGIRKANLKEMQDRGEENKRAVRGMFAEPSEPYGTCYLRIPTRDGLTRSREKPELTALCNYFH
ncbi:hypothetical protein WH47_01105 [Habropoda laboriosa]|uniref:Uncharacterized protein n=1 Tax=Habropoda laboriosa TaxID=597456 RepID=A0A0L7QYT4_9HYME|nr:hypothetical protein WH47_01105 [Habropoda laboriosa]